MSSPDGGARRMVAGRDDGGRRSSTSTAITVARVIFVSLVGYGGYLLVHSFEPPARWLLWAPLAVLGGVIAGVAVVALEQAARRLPMSRLFLSAIGALGGVLLAQLVASALIIFLPGAGTAGGRGFLSLLLAYMGVVFILRREEELGGITRMVFPGSGGGDARFKVLDTSVIIDGRIADVCQAGFLEGTLLVPQYVLRELQQIADSSDPLKRNRGRRGLDVLQRLQRLPGVRTELHDLDFPHIREVDARLIETARAVGGVIVTNDYNLNKVAELHGVRVLNINELAGALRPVVLPGEMLHVHVLREGKEAGQGVAYLDDGTMVVVEQGRRHIGQTVNITVNTVLQTAAGRMIFARLAEEESAGRR